MQLVPWVLVLLVVALGGIIAFLADRLGRALGKKRLSLFGLRPRHTAELLTVGAGVLIPLVTFSIIMAGSKEVRDWFRAGPAIIQDRDRLVREVSEMQKTEEGLAQRNEELTRENALERGNLEKTKAQVAQLEVQVKEQNERLASLQRETQGLQRQTRALQAKNQDLAAQREGLVRGLKVVQRDLDTSKKALAASLIETATVKKENEVLFAERDAAFLNRDSIDAENKALEGHNERLRAEEEKLTAEKARLEGAVEWLEARFEAVNLALERRNADLHRVQQDLAFAQITLGSNVEVTRTLPITFQMGEEVARIKIEPNVSEFRVRLAVNQLLDLALQNGRERGVTELLKTPDSATQLDEVVQRLTGQEMPLVLTAHALLNIFQGESLPLRILAWDNPIVYRQGQVVAEEQMDGRQSEDQILRQINDFLGRRVREQVVKDQMLPVAGHETSMIPITPEQVFSLVRAVRSSARPVRVVAMAEQETRASDQLKLSFAIR